MNNAKQLEWVCQIVMSSGIGTIQQRTALCQRIIDANEQRRNAAQVAAKAKINPESPK